MSGVVSTHVRLRMRCNVLEYGLQLTMVSLTVVCGTVFFNGGDKVCSLAWHLVHSHG